MGEVFKALDTRLDRNVAIKVLPASFARDPQFRLRFEREAKTISQLNHPNICTLHDIGHDNGIDYLVMELIEGESLADRLSRGPLPIAETLKLGAQIAFALDRAHRSGIVHRDLKPGNVMLTKSAVKLLDFGLAKGGAVKPAGLPDATEHKPLTAEGTILGTFQYMAPEQLEGNDADARTDLFALGAVLYEMVTGRRAFDGNTRTSLIAAIVASNPRPIIEVQPLTPPAFEHVVAKCLEKNPDDRWQSAHDVGEELRWISESSARSGVAHTRNPGAVLAWSAAGVFLAAAIVLGLLLREGGVQAETTPLYSSIVSPPGTTFAFETAPMAMSPDGRLIAFTVRGGGEKDALRIHDLTTNKTRVLSGTEGASFPFWSPDSRFLAFGANNQLKKIDVLTGSLETLVDTAAVSAGGTWNRDGTILFVPVRGEPICRFRAGTTEAPQPVTDKRTSRVARYPVFLPDGRHFLFSALSPASGDPTSGIYVGSIDSPETKFLFRSKSNALYSPPGWILHWDDGRLRAVGFDAAKRQLTGQAITVADDVQFNPSSHAGHYSLSATGSLVFRGGTTSFNSRLIWFGRDGKELGTVGADANYYGPSVSPDGTRVAVDISDAENNGDIWVVETARRVASRFSANPHDESSPVWSSDGYIYFFREARQGSDLYRKRDSGTGPDELILHSSERKHPTDITRDGRVMLFAVVREDDRGDLFLLPLQTRKPVPYLTSSAAEGEGRFSPDGRFVAYSCDETGVLEVFVRPLDPSAGKWQVSVGGGRAPRWSPDGAELYYIGPDRVLMSVRIHTQPAFGADEPKPLFQTSLKPAPGGAGMYSLSPDGARFLVNTLVEDSNATSITLMQNWRAKALRE